MFFVCNKTKQNKNNHPRYTEPDPRDDLNGMDVARKAVILARVSGMKGVELGGLSIESLVPEPLRACSAEEFLQGLAAFDEPFAARVAAVEAKGERLHYAAKVAERLLLFEGVG